MAYVDPTFETLKARFPAFATVDDAVVSQAITEAMRSVDQTWTEGDYTLAIMLRAAHILTLDGFGDAAEAKAAASGASGYKTMKSGALTLERFAPGEQGGNNGSLLASTSYGRRFLDLLRLNRGGPRVATGEDVSFPYRGSDYVA